jgi:hypothetical protein
MIWVTLPHWRLLSPFYLITRSARLHLQATLFILFSLPSICFAKVVWRTLVTVYWARSVLLQELCLLLLSFQVNNRLIFNISLLCSSERGLPSFLSSFRVKQRRARQPLTVPSVWILSVRMHLSWGYFCLLFKASFQGQFSIILDVARVFLGGGRTNKRFIIQLASVQYTAAKRRREMNLAHEPAASNSRLDVVLSTQLHFWCLICFHFDFVELGRGKEIARGVCGCSNHHSWGGGWGGG